MKRVPEEELLTCRLERQEWKPHTIQEASNQKGDEKMPDYNCDIGCNMGAHTLWVCMMRRDPSMLWLPGAALGFA